MMMPGRKFNAASLYRYGFNGKEQDQETYGDGNIYDYGFRIYNPRLGKFLSIDPLTSGYPFYTPYQFAGNKPIVAIDLDGLEEYFKNVIDQMTFGFKVLAKQTNSTYTASVGFDIKAGYGVFFGGAGSGSIGLGIDGNGNFAFTATNQSWIDLFKIFGGFAWGSKGNENKEGTYDKDAITLGGNVGIEFSGAWNRSSHIEGLAGETKEYEFDFDIFEFTIGKGNDKLSSIEVSIGPGFGIPSIQVSTTNTKVIGMNSQNVNDLVNVLLEAEKIYNDNNGNNLRPLNQKISKGFLWKNTGDNKYELIIKVLYEYQNGEIKELFSKTALTLYPKDGNYMRTGEVAETESDNNKEKK